MAQVSAEAARIRVEETSSSKIMEFLEMRWVLSSPLPGSALVLPRGTRPVLLAISKT